MDELTHFNKDGLSHMVDVSNKTNTERIAKAKVEIHMNSNTLNKIKEGTIEKGNVLAVSQVAGIMASKKTPELIPMCHQIPLTSSDIFFEYKDYGIEIESIVKTNYITGVEMDALVSASTAALTIYDMVKAIDKTMKITNLRVTYKCGGKSGEVFYD